MGTESFRESESTTSWISLELSLRCGRSECGWFKLSSNIFVYTSVFYLYLKERSMMKDWLWRCIIMKPLMMMKASPSLECEKYRYNLFYSNIYFLTCTNTNCMYWNKFC